MRPSFILFAVADLLLLTLTAVLGITVSGTHGFVRHFLLGILAALFTCFVHIVLFMYFVVQEKVMKQACLRDGLDGRFVHRTGQLKARALRAALAGILSILVVVALGGAIGIVLSSQAHFVAAYAAVATNAAIFAFQYWLLLRFDDVFAEAFPEG